MPATLGTVAPDDIPAEVEHVLTAIEALLDHLDGRQPLFTSRIEEAHRQYAAAALCRGCAMVRSGLITLRAGQVEAVGVLARTAWECWLIGTFLVCGGAKSFVRLEAEQLRQNSNVARLNGFPSAVLNERWSELRKTERYRRILEDGLSTDDSSPVTFDKLTVEQLAREVGPMIPAAMGGPADVIGIYDKFYRAHSAWDTHGIQALDRRIALLAEDGRIELKAAVGWLEPEKPLATATAYLALLARQIFHEFGISPRKLDDLAEALLTHMGNAVGLGSNFDEWPGRAAELLSDAQAAPI